MNTFLASLCFIGFFIAGSLGVWSQGSSSQERVIYDKMEILPAGEVTQARFIAIESVLKRTAGYLEHTDFRWRGYGGTPDAVFEVLPQGSGFFLKAVGKELYWTAKEEQPLTSNQSEAQLFYSDEEIFFSSDWFHLFVDGLSYKTASLLRTEPLDANTTRFVLAEDRLSYSYWKMSTPSPSDRYDVSSVLRFWKVVPRVVSNESDYWKERWQLHKGKVKQTLSHLDFFNEKKFDERAKSLSTPSTEETFLSNKEALIPLVFEQSVCPPNGALLRIKSVLKPAENEPTEGEGDFMGFQETWMTGSLQNDQLSLPLLTTSYSFDSPDYTLAADRMDALFYYDEQRITCLGTGSTIAVENGVLKDEAHSDNAKVKFSPILDDRGYRLSYGDKYLRGNSECSHVEVGETVNGETANFVLSKVDRIPVSVGSSGYATFWTPVPLDVYFPNEVYRAVRRPGDSFLTLIKIEDVIPAGTAFIIKSEPNEIVSLIVSDNNFPPPPSFTLEENQLVGGPRAIKHNNKTYGLTQTENGEVVFALLDSSIKQRAFKAYYVDTGGGSTRELFLDIKGSLSNVSTMSLKNPDAVFYDLSGRRVKTPIQQGIYMKGREKVMIK